MEVMRGNLGRLEVLARETLDLAASHRLLDTVERHREQLTACQRQFRLANVKVQSVVSPTAGPQLPGLRQAEVQGGGVLYRGRLSMITSSQNSPRFSGHWSLVHQEAKLVLKLLESIFSQIHIGPFWHFTPIPALTELNVNGKEKYMLHQINNNLATMIFGKY